MDCATEAIHVRTIQCGSKPISFLGKGVGEEGERVGRKGEVVVEEGGGEGRVGRRGEGGSGRKDSTGA